MALFAVLMMFADEGAGLSRYVQDFLRDMRLYKNSCVASLDLKTKFFHLVNYKNRQILSIVNLL